MNKQRKNDRNTKKNQGRMIERWKETNKESSKYK